jgi:hypothetical protein
LEFRFIPKRLGEGRDITWRVYDLQRGCFPFQTPELGKVSQDFPGRPGEALAQAECDRLTAKVGGLDQTAKRRAASKTSATPSKPSIDDDDQDNDED